MTLLQKIWKESATLIICGRNANNVYANGANYRILVMKRSSRSTFMPNIVVFPGGAIEPADSRPDWLATLRQLGTAERQLAGLHPRNQSAASRPFIFDRTHPIHATSAAELVAIDRNVSLRLSAIRETFEEVGILIGSAAEAEAEAVAKRDGGELTQVCDVADAKRWQLEVHEDAEQFRALCTQQRIRPNVAALYEWCNWMTPTTFANRRFDTAFYLATLNAQPAVLAERTEVQEYLWAAPAELLRMYEAREVIFAPPQLFELSRLSHIADIEELQRFAAARQELGCTHFYPVPLKVRDGMVFLYPGDEMYPAQLDYVGDVHDMLQFADTSMAELRQRCVRMLRMEQPAEGGARTVSTVEQTNGHLSPVPGVVKQAQL